MTDDVVVTRVIAASPATVFSFFVDADRWASWQGAEATLDAGPGGAFRIRMPGGQVASGEFVTVDPDRRLVLTWGWEPGGPPAPPGSTMITVEFEPHADGTLVRLTHSGLPGALREPHREGWERDLGRLGARLAGPTEEASR
jgi:uncharacterized protein YndB with AHSA1/START domain